jgi:diguanylate cyclase (GGDEF)-like protein
MEEASQNVPRSRAGLGVTWLAAASLYFLLAASTIHLTSDGKTIAAVWPANAVLVALLLAQPAPRWLTVLSAGLVGNIAANLLTRGTIAGPLLYSIANCVEVVVAALLIRQRTATVELLRSTRSLVRFFVAAGIVAPMISALLGAATAATVYDQAFASSFAAWFLSDGLGLLVFTPVFTALVNGQVAACFLSRTATQRVGAIALIAMVAATAYAVFFVATSPALFLLYAPVMLVTFRIGPVGTKMAVVTIAVTGLCAMASGHGPVVMVATDPTVQAHLFQAFLAMLLLTCLPVAAEISERNRLAEQLKERVAEAHIEATTDTLTGLLNRRGFDRAVAALLAERPALLCCVAIDVDRFKSINDRWGHQVGDRVLQHLAATLRSNTRPGDLIGRLGGDEFMMILRVSDRSDGEAICARIQAALRQQPIAADEKTQIMVAISCGISGFGNGDTFTDAARRADTALYQAKDGGRNTIRAAR